MLSLGQKLIAIVSLVFIEVVALFFFPLMAFVALIFTVPLAVLILKR